MDKTTDHSKSSNDMEKLSGKRDHITRRNMKK